MLIKLLQSHLKLIKTPINFIRPCSSSVSSASKDNSEAEFKDWREKLHSTMTIQENFISKEEENSLMNELGPYLKRLRYEYSHWDDRIHGYRETEYLRWNEQNKSIINKLRTAAFPSDMPQNKLVHVLDLAEDGWIKPHVDSTRFCGDIIATISLLSDCVMRLTYVGHEKEYQDDFFIPRRSLYIMKGVARYNYNHEILSKKESMYKGKVVEKKRRISVICRSEPE